MERKSVEMQRKCERMRSSLFRQDESFDYKRRTTRPDSLTSITHRWYSGITGDTEKGERVFRTHGTSREHTFCFVFSLICFLCLLKKEHSVEEKDPVGSNWRRPGETLLIVTWNTIQSEVGRLYQVWLSFLNSDIPYKRDFHIPVWCVVFLPISFLFPTVSLSLSLSLCPTTVSYFITPSFPHLLSEYSSQNVPYPET